MGLKPKKNRAGKAGQSQIAIDTRSEPPASEITNTAVQEHVPKAHVVKIPLDLKDRSTSAPASPGSDSINRELIFRQLFEKNLAGVFVSTIEGKIVDCNDSFAHMFGYESRAQALAQPAVSFYGTASDRHEFIEKLRHAKSFTNLEGLYRTRDGSPLWVLENVALLQENGHGQELIQGTLVDITERKRTEQALIESESKFRAVADTAASAIFIHNGTEFLYLNRSCEQMSEYSHDELMRMTPMDIVHPDDWGFVGRRSMQRLSGEPVPGRY